MYYKKCPFCNNSVKEYYDIDTKSYILKCTHCEEKGIIVKIQSTSLEELKELWNNRKEETDIYEIGRSNYGYLIFPDSEVKKCDDSHPEELLRYLGISTDIVDENNFDCEKICQKLGIIRVCEHCHCIMIEMPKKITKKQIDNCINVMGNYKTYNKFYISYDDNIIYETNNLNDLIIKLDGLSNEW